MREGNAKGSVVRAVVAAGVALVCFVAAAPASAIRGGPPRLRRYANCRSQWHDHPSGVARSYRAADRQWAHGFAWPAIDRGIYHANRRLDRDHDNTICERPRATATPASVLSVPPPPRRFATCKAMRQTFRFGVARSDAAADRQTSGGFRRPLVSGRVYRKNRRLDRDNDGTACEVPEP